MSSSGPLLALEGIGKTYGGGTAHEVTVLAGVDLALAAGESVAVLGPSGSGKSTLLSIAGTLEPPSTGRVRFEGRDLADLDADGIARFRRREVGFVFQHHHLLPQLSALENVLLPTLADGASELPGQREARGRALELLARIGLAARASHRPAELSGGERQRVAVVRAMINRPRLLLLDEPTGSLDARSADSLGDLLCEVGEREGVALLLVTHSVRLAERMQRAVHLADGFLVAEPASRGAR